MKKLISVLFGALLVCALLVTSVCAESENKLLKDAKWIKYMSKVDPTVKQEDGADVVSLGAVTTPYSSCGIDVYPSLKKLLGEEDSISVYFVFEAKVEYADKADAGKEYPFGIKLRPDGLTAVGKDQDKYSEEYEGTNFKYDNSNLSCTLVSSSLGEKMTDEWALFEIQKEFDAADFNDKLYSKWMFCFDNMSEYESASDMKIRNFSIYTEDEYEPVEAEKPEKKDDNKDGTNANLGSDSFDEKVISKPYNYDRYPITFAKTKENPVPDSMKNSEASENSGATDGVTEPTDTAEAAETNNTDGKSYTGIIIAVAAAVVVAVGACVIVILKKKKGDTK